jgi:hypothetical protein
MRVTVHNRGPEAATIHLLPQLWFRNTWSWKPNGAKPELSQSNRGAISAKHPNSANTRYISMGATLSFLLRQRDQRPSPLTVSRMRQGFFKDAFDEYLVTAITPR